MAEAKPIFVKAITSITIKDAFTLLRGEENAATEYLRHTTGASLAASFDQEVTKAVEAVNLTKFYNPLADAYNTSTPLTGG